MAKEQSAAQKVAELKARMAKNAPKLSEVKKSNDVDNADLGFNGFSDFLEFEDGKTIKLRFFPSHNQGENFFLLRKRTWLPRENNQGEIGKTTILDSRRHGGTKLDLVDEYRKLANKVVKSSDAALLKKINDSYGGIGPSHEWIAYAVKSLGEKREFGLIAFKKTVRDEINKINFIEEDDEPVESVDTFTGEGYPLLVKYISKPNKKKGEDYYACQKGKKPMDLEDEEIIKWGEATPLSEIYMDVYKMKDFEKALECLQLFDETEEVGVFDDERWEEIVEEVKAQYDDEDEEEDDEPAPKKKVVAKKPVKKVVEEEEDEDEDEEDEEEDEPAPKKPIKKPIKKVVEEEEDEDEEDEEEDEPAPKKPFKKPIKKAVEEDDEDEEEDEPAPKKSSISIDDIRARLKNRGK